MKRPELSYRPREGDEFFVLARAKYDVDPGEGDVHIELVAADYVKARIKLDDIQAIHRRRWKVGDWVRTPTGVIAKVLAIYNDVLWVIDRSYDNVDPGTVHGPSCELYRSADAPAADDGSGIKFSGETVGTTMTVAP